jgi:2-keto-4-pentenoate hydratase
VLAVEEKARYPSATSSSASGVTAEQADAVTALAASYRLLNSGAEGINCEPASNFDERNGQGDVGRRPGPRSWQRPWPDEESTMSVKDPHTKAKALYEARRARVPIPPFTDDDPTLGMADGYAVQQELVALLLADGDRIIGHKVGLTSKPMQQMIGVDSPDYGPVLASTVFRDGDTIPLDRFIAPRIEAEIVFVLGERLQGPGVTLEQARAAISGAVAGMEIVDSRIEDWRIKLADTVADLASNGAMAVSSAVVPIEGLDSRLIGMVLTQNGELIATGAGAAALGDPVAVVAWLANVLGENGVALDAGHMIMTGALHAAVPMDPGDVFVAEFDRLGSVTVRVSEGS